MPQAARLCDACSSQSGASTCASCGAFVPSKVGGLPPAAPLCARHASSDSGKMCFLCKTRPAGALSVRICWTCAKTPAGQECVICKDGLDWGDVKKLLGGFKP